MDIIFYHRTTDTNSPILSNHLEITCHLNPYTKGMKIVNIIFNCILQHNIYILLFSTEYYVPREMGEIIFHMIILLVKRLHNQITFPNSNNKKTYGLINKIIIEDIYTLIYIMSVGYKETRCKFFFNKENMNIRLTQISNILGSIWKVSMICKNIFLMDLPFHIINRLIIIENDLGKNRVDVNKEMRVNIIRDILIMVVCRNECISCGGGTDGFKIIESILNSRLYVNSDIGWYKNCQFDILSFLQKDFVVKRLKELLYCPYTQNKISDFIQMIFRIVPNEKMFRLTHSISEQFREYKEKLKGLSNMTAENFSNIQGSFLHCPNFLSIYERNYCTSNIPKDSINLFGSHMKKNRAIIKYIGLEVNKNNFYSQRNGNEEENNIKINCILTHFAWKIMGSMNKKHRERYVVEIRNILSEIERILSKSDREKVENMIELLQRI